MRSIPSLFVLRVALIALCIGSLACADVTEPTQRLAPEAPQLLTRTVSGGTAYDIQDAVNASAPGDIVVLEGDITMNKAGGVVLKSGVTIRGAAGHRLIGTGYTFFQKDQSTSLLEDVVLEYIVADGESKDGAFVDIYHKGTADATVRNIRIEGNNITRFPLNGIRIAGVANKGRQYYKSITIKNNTIGVIGKTAINLSGRGTQDCCVNGPVTISGNDIYDVGTPSLAKVGFGINVAHADGITINGNNKVRQTCEDGIRVTVSKNAKIEFNVVDGVHSGSCDTEGIKSDGSHDVTIRNNTVKYMTHLPHILVLKGRRNYVFDNTIVGKGDSSKFGIVVRSWEQGPARDFWLQGNSVKQVINGITLYSSFGYEVSGGTVYKNNVDSVCTGIWLGRDPDGDHVRDINIRENTIGRQPFISCSAYVPIALRQAGYIDIHYNQMWDVDAMVIEGSWDISILGNTEDPAL